MISIILAICILISCVVPMGPTALEAGTLIMEFANSETVYEIKQNGVLEIKDLDKVVIPGETTSETPINTSDMTSQVTNNKAPQIPDKYTKIVSDANGLMKGNKMSLNYNIALKDGSAANFTLKHEGNTAYINADGIKQLMAIIESNAKDFDIENPEIINKALERINNYQFISFKDKDGTSLPANIETLNIKEGQELFAEFDNGLLQKTADGTYIYKLDVGTLSNSAKSVYDRLIELEWFRTDISDPNISKDDIKDFIINIFDEVSEALKGSFIYAEIKKVNENTLTLNLKVMVYLYNTNIISYSQESQIIKTSLSDFDASVSSSIPFEIVEDYYYMALARQYDINKLHISWDTVDGVPSEEFAVTYSGTNGTFNRNHETISQNGRIYLPLRMVCEALNETVEWDSTQNKAYIVRNGEKVDMTGMIVDGKTYVMIRDFETKLGYKLNYSNSDFAYENIVTVYHFADLVKE